MAKRQIQRITRDRRLTAAEGAELKKLRDAIELEKPDIRLRALLRRNGSQLTEAARALKLERERQGLSLADVFERSGIEQSALSALEDGAAGNPTIRTLTRYAKALGKAIYIQIVDEAEGAKRG